MASALIVVSGSNVWTMKNGKPHPCGFWAIEFIEAHQRFTGAGMKVTVAAPGGLTPTVDPLSYDLGYNDNDTKAITSQKDYIAKLGDAVTKPANLNDCKPSDFDVVFLIGGHGPMQDLAVHPTIGSLLTGILNDPKKVVGAVCHGLAGFLTAHQADGTWLFKGRSMTCFSNEEENMATFAGNAPWLLEDRLRLAGGLLDIGPAYQPHVVEDGNLITGQQNHSSGVAADAILKYLAGRK